MTPWWRSALARILRVALIVLPLTACLAMLGGLVWAAWWMSSRTETRTTLPLTMVTLILLGVVVTTVSQVRSSRSRPVTDGVELAEDIQPALWAAVRAVAASVGVAPPDRLYLGLDPMQVGLIARTGLRDRRRRVLVLGLAPLCALSPQQWHAAVAQALLMEESGTRRERRLLRGQRWMTAVESGAPGAKWVRWTRALPFRAHAWLARPTCRRRQFEADLRSAELTTPDDARLALLMVPAAEGAWARFWDLHVEPATGILRRPIDVVAGFRMYLSVVGIPDWSPMAPELTTASHPFVSLETRLAALSVNTQRMVAPIPPDANVAGAVDLLGQPSVLVDLELAWFKGTGLTPLDWDGLAHAIASRESQRRAAWLLDELSTTEHPADLSNILEDLARTGGRTLQQVVVGESLDDAAPDPDLQWYVASLVGDVIAAALVETAGARYVMNWAGPATLVGADDAVLDPWSAAATVIFEPDRAADLGRWCLDFGAPTDYRAFQPGPHLDRTIMDSDPVVLCSACLFIDKGPIYVVVLDTGLIVMRPSFSDELVSVAASYTQDAGEVLLRRWSQSSGVELMSAKKAIYTDWTEIRSAVMTTRSRGRLTLEIERVDGPSTKLKCDGRSRFHGDFANLLAHFLGERLVLQSA